MNIQFNPAALLSLGDAHAFVQALLDIAPKAPGVPKGGPTPSTVSTNTKMAQLDSGPEMGEQMAQRGAITSRSADEVPHQGKGEIAACVSQQGCSCYDLRESQPCDVHSGWTIANMTSQPLMMIA